MITPQRFKEWAPRMMVDLIRDFGLTDFQAAGIVGNGGHESGGFVNMQELNPTVPGSRGGLGAFQWTASRRDAFEAWLKRNSDKGWSAHTYEANYSMLFRELVSTEKRALDAVRRTKSLGEATRVFCDRFERPGIVHMEQRLDWAQEALQLYRALPPEPEPTVPVADVEEQLRKMEDLLLAFLTGLGESPELELAKARVKECRFWALEHLELSKP